MRIALMQPYFFPYIGYFMLIRHSDKFIAFDTVQFEKGGWINRNRILKRGGGYVYINAVMKKSPRGTAIKDIKLKNEFDWRNRILSQMEVYKKLAPNYSKVMEFLRRTLDYKTDSLSDMNLHLLKKVCEYIGIEYDIELLSEMELELGEIEESDDWGIAVSKALNAEEYINAPGGANFYNRDKYRDRGIDIKFIDPNISPYNQKNGDFEPYLSILDVMMFNNEKEIIDMLDNCIFF